MKSQWSGWTGAIAWGLDQERNLSRGGEEHDVIELETDAAFGGETKADSPSLQPQASSPCGTNLG